MRILLAEDDKAINRVIVRRLKWEGYSVDACFDGQEALDYLAAVEYDAVILDVMMPKVDGFEVLTQMRERGDKTPTLFLTARDALEDKVEGLDLGADDYLVKPFGMMEMVSRIKAVLRRIAPKQAKVLACGGITLDESRHSVAVCGTPVSLTLKEYELLKLFMENTDRVFTREVLLSEIWGKDFIGETRTVDVHIGTLRTKLARAGGLIETVRGVGYRMGERHER